MGEKMKETEIVQRFSISKQRASANGITLMSGEDVFFFNDIPNARGSISYKTLEEVEIFIHGYSHGYTAGLKKNC